jgi:hypothetical protein
MMIIKNILFRFPFLAALIAQLLSLFFLRNFFLFTKINVSAFQFLCAQCLCSILIVHFVFKLPKWFYYISIFIPVLFFIDFNYLHLSKNIYGILFLILGLTFSHTLIDRVPLYLSNQSTIDALAILIEKKEAQFFLDLGSGLGGVVREMAKTKVKSFGVESAPMLWIISSIICFHKGKILRQNIWNTDLSNYDVVYAFLSPAVMDKLFLKIQKEMKKNSLFISNSFEIQGIDPSEIIILKDQRQTKLYLYEMSKFK